MALVVTASVYFQGACVYRYLRPGFFPDAIPYQCRCFCIWIPVFEVEAIPQDCGLSLPEGVKERRGGQERME